MTEFKKFVIEKDIIEIAGEEAIKNTTRGGNHVYLNIEELERLSAKEEENGEFGPFSDTLKYLNEFEIQENEEEKLFISLENKGKIFLEEEFNHSKDTIHLTNRQTTISKLKRKKIPQDFPKFLHFGPELIEDGIITLENKVLNELGEIKLGNKQPIENPYDKMDMKQYFEKNPKIIRKLKNQNLDEYFTQNTAFNRTYVSTFNRGGLNLIIKTLTKDIKKKNLEKRGIKKSEAEKKSVNIFQAMIEPYKEYSNKNLEKSITFNLESIIDITQDEYFNNQVLKIGPDYFNVKNKLIEHTHKDYKTGRYSIDEEVPATLELISRDVQNITSLRNFKPRNIEQIIAFKQLINPDIEMTILEGGSGSGKTVVAYAAALEMILQSNTNKNPQYDGIILFKSNDIIGGKKREMGFLPGSAYEKVKVFMKSFEDAHNLLGLNQGNKGMEFNEMLSHPTNEKDEFGLREHHEINGMKLPPNNRVIEIEHLQFARGRTFENKIIFVDEGQNYSPYEMKQLIERVGIGCKIIMVGDSEGQIDNPSLNRNFNGLTYSAAINAYNKHPRFSMTKLVSNYRSQSAEIMRNQKAIGTNL